MLDLFESLETTTIAIVLGVAAVIVAVGVSVYRLLGGKLMLERLGHQVGLGLSTILVTVLATIGHEFLESVIIQGWALVWCGDRARSDSAFCVGWQHPTPGPEVTPQPPGKVPTPEMPKQVPEVDADPYAKTANATFRTGLVKHNYENVSNGETLARHVLLSRSISELERASSAGDAEAAYLLGIAKWSGIDTEPDEKAARKLIEQAVQSNFPRAKLALATMLRDGVGSEQKDPAAAFAIVHSCAEVHTFCRAELGTYYQYPPEGGQPDTKKAREQYEMAALKEYPPAFSYLGEMALLGIDEDRDPAKALGLFRRAADVYEAEAIWRVGDAYRHGWGGVEIDRPRGLRLLRRAAELGHAQSAVDSAEMLIGGEGVLVDTHGAAQLLSVVSCHLPGCKGGDWTATAMLAGLLVRAEAKLLHVGAAEIESMSIASDEHGHVQPIATLVSALSEGKFGHPKDNLRVAKLARGALSRLRSRPLNDEAAWPVYGVTFANAIRRAMLDGGLTPGEAKEARQLEAWYGAVDRPLRRFSAPIDCEGAADRFSFYVWDVTEGPPPTDLQFDWLEGARKCKVSKDIRDAFRKLFDIAKTNNVSFSDLCVYALKQPEDNNRTTPPISIWERFVAWLS